MSSYFYLVEHIYNESVPTQSISRSLQRQFPLHGFFLYMDHTFLFLCMSQFFVKMEILDNILKQFWIQIPSLPFRFLLLDCFVIQWNYFSEVYFSLDTELLLLVRGYSLRHAQFSCPPGMTVVLICLSLTISLPGVLIKLVANLLLLVLYPAVGLCSLLMIALQFSRMLCSINCSMV